MANANCSPNLHSPITPILIQMTTKKTPSTSTKKKRECSIALEDEEYTFSPNSDSVFDLPELDLHSPIAEVNCQMLTPYPVENKPTTSVDVHKLSISSFNGSAVCRICHSGEYSSPVKGESLISACYCRGTMGLFHRSCLEMWLSTSNRDQCEICKFQYITERVPRPFSEFLKNPGSAAAKRNLVGDFICWCILTPLTAASAWLCVSGAIHYADQNKDNVEVPGLVCLAVFLAITYAVWLTVSIRYHYKVWHDWRIRNQKVRVMAIKEIMKQGYTNATASKPQLAKAPRSRAHSVVSSGSIQFHPPWNASLQVLRSDLRAAAITSPASLTVRFTYPIGSVGVYETAL